MADDERPGTVADDTGPRATVIQLDRAAPPSGSRARSLDAVGPDAADGDAAAGHVAGGDAAGSPSSGSSAVVVDERMRRRRIAVLRAAGQRRLRRIIWVLVPVAAVVDGAALAHTSLLDVDRVVVEAAEHTSAASIRRAAGIDRGDALVTLDEHGAERAVERLPWVDRADVVRGWMGTVRIRVTERVPAAVLPGAEGASSALVDRDGRVLDIGGPIPFGVMPITGLEAEVREGTMLRAAAMDALVLGVTLNERLPGVAIAVDVTMDATLNQGGIARFGSLEQLDDKLVALEAFVSDVDLSGLAVLDLRVPDNPTIRRH